MQRAYSLLHVKAIGEDERRITGIATSPEPDRQGDIVELSGVTCTNPIPLLLHHDKTQPVGRATLGQATADGIPFDAILPVMTDPGRVKDRIDEAWHSIKAGLIAGISIGFRVVNDAIDVVKKTGGLHFKQIEILELSLVTIPANVSASIRTIKQFDTAVSRPTLSGVPGAFPKGTAMTTAELIQQFENSRAAKSARMTDIMKQAAADGATLNDDQATEYDGFEKQVKDIDTHLVRLHQLEATEAKAATPITSTVRTTQASELRGGHPVVTVKPNVEKGTQFVRAACALLHCKGNWDSAANYAARWNDSTPEVGLYLKAAVAAGNTTDAAWAAPLVNQTILSDFLELLRPATIIGKISGFRTVPFNCKVTSQSGGGTYGWVGEGKSKPVTALAFTTTSLPYHKVAGIIVLTQELVRLSNPSAEQAARKDMVNGIAQFLDAQFIDPAITATAGVRPASVTNGAPTAAATANPLADLMGLINHFVTANISPAGVHVILSAANALALSFQTNLDGTREFPGIGVNGGEYRGLTFITSQAAGTNVIALQPDLVLYADDGGVTIDSSDQASLQMDSAPVTPADATTVYVSLWQLNMVGLRAERSITWLRANANAVKYLTAAAWPAPTGSGAVREGLAPKEAKH